MTKHKKAHYIVRYCGAAIMSALAQSAIADDITLGDLLGLDPVKWAQAAWNSAPKNRVACLSSLLQQQNYELNYLIRNGIGPDDNQLAAYNAECQKRENEEAARLEAEEQAKAEEEARLQKEQEQRQAEERAKEKERIAGLKKLNLAANQNCQIEFEKKRFESFCDNFLFRKDDLENKSQISIQQAIKDGLTIDQLKIIPIEREDAKKRRKEMVTAFQYLNIVPTPNTINCIKTKTNNENMICNSYELTFLNNLELEYLSKAKAYENKGDVGKKDAELKKSRQLCKDDQTCFKQSMVMAIDYWSEFLNNKGNQTNKYIQTIDSRNKENDEKKVLFEAEQKKLAEQEAQKLAIAQAEAEKEKARAEAAKAEAELAKARAEEEAAKLAASKKQLDEFWDKNFFNVKWGYSGIPCNLNGGAYSIFSRNSETGETLYFGGKPGNNEGPHKFNFEYNDDKSITYNWTAYVGKNQLLLDSGFNSNEPKLISSQRITIIDENTISIKKEWKQIDVEAILKSRQKKYENKSEEVKKRKCDKDLKTSNIDSSPSNTNIEQPTNQSVVQNTEACKKNWRACASIEEAINNNQDMIKIKRACVDATNDQSKYGEPEWGWLSPIASFGTFSYSPMLETEFKTKGSVKLSEKGLLIPNKFGGKEKHNITCLATFDDFFATVYID